MMSVSVSSEGEPRKKSCEGARSQRMFILTAVGAGEMGKAGGGSEKVAERLTTAGSTSLKHSSNHVGWLKREFR